MADSIDRQAGLTSYWKYHVLMAKLAARYDCTTAQATAVFVATSPNNDYINNLRSTVSILDGWRDGVTVDKVKISTYHHAKHRAWSYLHGVDFLETASGPKTRAFYQNIVDPTDPKPVTVDGHIYSAWFGKRLLMRDAGMSQPLYTIIAEDMRWVAHSLGILPNQLQATIWFAWKRVHKIVHENNLDIFGDHLRLDINIYDIKPYTRNK